MGLDQMALNSFTKRTRDEYPVIEEVAKHCDLHIFTIVALYDFFGSWQALWDLLDSEHYYNRYAVKTPISESTKNAIRELQRAYQNSYSTNG